MRDPGQQQQPWNSAPFAHNSHSLRLLSNAPAGCGRNITPALRAHPSRLNIPDVRSLPNLTFPDLSAIGSREASELRLRSQLTPKRLAPSALYLPHARL